VEQAKNRETHIPVGILVENPLPFYMFSKCLLPKNELSKNAPLLLIHIDNQSVVTILNKKIVNIMQGHESGKKTGLSIPKVQHSN
jgi:hypothetical protein